MRQIAVDGAVCSYRQTGEGVVWLGFGSVEVGLLQLGCGLSLLRTAPAPKQVSVRQPQTPGERGARGQGLEMSLRLVDCWADFLTTVLPANDIIAFLCVCSGSNIQVRIASAKHGNHEVS